jgi:Zn-dependent protease
VIHEVAHGWVAYRLGDETAKRMGRLTLNPLPHIDLVGTIILPFIMIIWGGPVFGWAKPVPFNPLNFRKTVNIRNGIMWVALAGACSNLILAFIFSFLLVILQKFFSGSPPLLYYMLTQLAQVLILINLILATLNLIPIPPLDGSKVLMRILPIRYEPYFLQVERYGFIIIIILFATGVFSKLIWVPVYFLADLFHRIPSLLFGII